MGPHPRDEVTGLPCPLSLSPAPPAGLLVQIRTGWPPPYPLSSGACLALGLHSTSEDPQTPRKALLLHSWRQGVAQAAPQSASASRVSGTQTPPSDQERRPTHHALHFGAVWPPGDSSAPVQPGLPWLPCSRGSDTPRAERGLGQPLRSAHSRALAVDGVGGPFPHPSWPAPEPPQLTGSRPGWGPWGACGGDRQYLPRLSGRPRGSLGWTVQGDKPERSQAGRTEPRAAVGGACSAWAASVRVSVQMCGECGTRWRGSSARDEAHAGCRGVVCEAECVAPGAAALPRPASQGPGFIWPPRAPGGQGCQPPQTPLPWSFFPQPAAGSRLASLCAGENCAPVILMRR